MSRPAQGDTVDLTDPSLYASGDANAVWRLLRSRAAVCWQREASGPGFWAVTRHADVLGVLRDPATFSSAGGTLLTANRTRPDPGGGKMLALSDPPRHGKLRRLVSPRFTERAIAGLSSKLEALVAELLDAAMEHRRVEFVQAVTAPVPVFAICELLGIDGEERLSILESTAGVTATDELEQNLAHQEIFFRLLELVEARRRAPRDDLITVLANAEVDGARLTDEEVLLNCNNLLVAGTETVRLAAAGGVLALIENPSQWQRLRSEPAVLGTAVEEILRWTSPALHLLRTARRRVTLGGKSIEAGEQVVTWLPSANRDELAFDRPDRFDIGRTANPHVALGAGRHFCLGAHLARLELGILFRQLATKARGLSLTGSPERLSSIIVFGLRSLPLEIAPR